ncbi:tyrosinase family protein [Chromobacterium sphagni]|uniref:Tyrosinase copper-binding domain-containing protein n=1 Tax=Chromobacterium sphagni TaxID=1903179 RepID=A0ABX3CA99_9NEIS|nr:tyrosinase family protein [Chromobacterium sphagni]OHX19205.1 hypothetical protein BI344_18760 [Chromobacterium sphagni]
MSEFNRRQLLLGGAIVFGSLALPVSAKPLLIPRRQLHTRYSVASAEGQAMLAIYASAVKKMMDPAQYPEGNPLNWIFQWYTHFVRADKTKQQELARVYPVNDPNKVLATKVWDTCQAHSSGQREDFFLPWHRMFIGYFEEIIRQVSGKPNFTLPYWDYTDPVQQILPVDFRKQGDPVWNSLYRASRWPQTNAGQNITQGPGGADLNLNAMKSNLYSGTSGGDAGFCANLDMNPHGALHVDVGNNVGMASVPWAANDPIFWLHHCNIDRIWASWNFAGGKNPADPAFLNTQFVFAGPTGGAVVGTVKDFLAVPKTAYDHYAQRPAGSLPFPKRMPVLLSPQFALQMENVATEKSAPVRLGNAPVTVDLANPAPAAEATQRNQLFSAKLRSLKKQANLFLRLEGLSAHGVVNGVYNVYVHANDAPSQDTRGPAFVGQINFFSAAGTHQHDDATGGEGNNPDKKAFSFLLSAETRALLAQSNTDVPRVTLVPTGTGNADALPSIDKIALVAS